MQLFKLQSKYASESVLSTCIDQFAKIHMGHLMSSVYCAMISNKLDIINPAKNPPYLNKNQNICQISTPHLRPTNSQQFL